MDNCFTGRRDRSRQTSEKDVLYIIPAGPVRRAHSPGGASYFLFLSRQRDVIASFSFGGWRVKTCFHDKRIFCSTPNSTALFHLLRRSEVFSTTMSSPGQRRGSCGHAMAGFESHSKCARCRDKGLGTTPASRRKNVISVEGLPLNRSFNWLHQLIETEKRRRRLRPPPPPLSRTLHTLVYWVEWRRSRLCSLPLLRRRNVVSLLSLLPARRNLSAVDHQLKI